VVGFALGDLRLTPAAFWRLTWREYLMMAAGFHRRQVRKWHHTRFLATVLVNVNRDPDSPPVTPEELMPLPGDAPAPEPMSLEELETELARVAAIDTDWL
jgi:hypothetical protein